MRLSFGLTGAVALLIASTGCSALASRPASAGTQAPPSVEILEYLDVRLSTEFVDVGRRGGSPGPGDAYYFASALRSTSVDDAIASRGLGTFVSVCAFVVGARAKCAGSLLLLDGTLELAGAPDLGSNTPIVAAVVGGSGRYAGVAGVATISPTSEENESRLVVRLQRDAGR